MKLPPMLKSLTLLLFFIMQDLFLMKILRAHEEKWLNIDNNSPFLDT